jgi:hypothetical protein
LISVSGSVPVLESISLNENCVLTTSESECEGKVARALQCDVQGKGTFVYCYAITTPYGSDIGHFFPAQVRRPEVQVISSSVESNAAATTTTGGGAAAKTSNGQPRQQQRIARVAEAADATSVVVEGTQVCARI